MSFCHIGWIRRGITAVLAYLSVLSFARIISLNGEGGVYFGGSYFGYNLSSILLFGGISWLLWRFFQRDDRRLKVIASVGGILLGAAIVYGGYAHYSNDIFISVSESVLQVFLIAGISVCTTPVCAEFFQLSDRMGTWYMKKQQTCPADHKARYFLLIWGGLMLSYTPLFLTQWPGNFVFDARFQILEVLRNDYHTHHPPLHTLLLGTAYRLGERMGNVAVGFQFYTLLQMLILTSAFAYLLLYFYKKRIPRCIRIGIFLWFALFPMHPAFAISATKDVLFAAFFLYYALFLFRLVVDREKFAWCSYAGMILTGVLLSLLRNNAFYALCVSGIVLIFFLRARKCRRYFATILTSIIVLYTVSQGGVKTYTNARDVDSARETLGVPLQCLARVACYRGEELDTDLYKEISMYIREEDIDNYNPYLSDLVKNNANEDLLRSNKWNFFKLWGKVGLQFPDEYMESIITNTLGYWYPLNMGMYVSETVAIYHTLIGEGEEIVKRDYFPLAADLYDYLLLYGNCRNIPIVGYLFRNAPYVWLLILVLLWAIYKKRYSVLKWGMLPFMYLGTCFLGPTVALRYIYCLVVCAPLLLHCVMSLNAEQNKEYLSN